MYAIITSGCDNMYNYIKGTISEINTNYIVVDNNGIGYQIYVANPYSFEEGKEDKIYVYHQVSENGEFLYGLHTKDEKELFLKLINVKGLGPKMALPMFATGSVNGIVDAIERENVLYLKKFPKIGDKVARQIILDLKGKLTKSEDEINNSLSELVEVLTSLGYKQPEIKRVLPNIDQSLTVENQIKQALKLMLK